MLARLGWVLRGLQRRLWFRATLFSVAGVATALLALLLRDHIPAGLPTKVGADAVDKILTIIASSMLAVTTFSLSTMVTAYNAAASSVRVPSGWYLTPASHCRPRLGWKGWLSTSVPLLGWNDSA